MHGATIKNLKNQFLSHRKYSEPPLEHPDV